MHDPLSKFSQWLSDAHAHTAIHDATAMTLATATPDGAPSARIVLLKEATPDGFVFYGNMESRKFRELSANPRAALCFYWVPLNRQVRIEGSTVPVSEAEADAYFASRPRKRQLGAWTSQQSRPLSSRAEMEERLTQFTQQFAGGAVPRPPHWSGWRLVPHTMEFWVNSDARLHEREVYTRADAASPWQHTLLYP
ncbi:MAG: pyridoxamine 5'-phosphate oxidase [Alphaproteobacteria bacterium]|nr:pyridoxamine 5'-phosphate oxidase [Alphaproteobacteria bacterium]